MNQLAVMIGTLTTIVAALVWWMGRTAFAAAPKSAGASQPQPAATIAARVAKPGGAEL